MKSMKVFLVASLLLLLTVGLASAQSPAYQTSFITSVTYQNVSNATANVTFSFYQEGSGTPIQVAKTLAAGAGSSLFIGGLTEIPTNFSGSAVVSSDQPIVATLVQIPQGDTVKNRPLSNGFSSASPQVTIATVLKNKFNQTTKFSVQNAASGAIDIKVTLYNAEDSAAAPIVVDSLNVPAGSAKSYDLGTLSAITAGSFNGSAIVTAKLAGTQTDANIVASALELGTSTAKFNDAKAYEGVSGGAKTVFMATALCNVFGGQSSFYAVTNTSLTTATDVTVSYSGGKTETKNLGAGKKGSFAACTVNDPNYSGSATVTSTATDIVVVGKVQDAGRATAFLGEAAGSAKLALPYVRYTAESNFGAGQNRQRAFIAIQNVGNSEVTNVVVKYLNKNGEVVGTHTIASIASKGKAGSNASLATLTSGQNASALTEFGYPEGNPGGGFGGAVIVEKAGASLIAVVRVESNVGGTKVAEDYNGISVP
ncbi:MAG: hypothetical protein KJZ86_21885 [Caldilineaceae bacterium]|nr:hypothetical protein [Caldilineaceae bacterium]